MKTGPEAGHRVPARAADDPNLPLGGPGRSFKGLAGADRVRVEAAPADEPEKTAKVKIAKATADVDPPEALLEPIFDDK